MEKINRNKFFSTLGKGAVLAAVTTAIPVKFFSNLSKALEKKNIKVAIHPSAIKRNGKA